MITKDQTINKYCCLYVSEFHLEMILLPFIKKNINSSNIIIFTEYDLEDSIKKLLDRTNFKTEEKEQILDVKYWTNKNIEILENNKFNNYTIIINGSKNEVVIGPDTAPPESKAIIVNIFGVINISNIAEI